MKFSLLNRLGRASPRLLAAIERRFTAIPFVKARLQKEYDARLAGVERSVKPYRDGFTSHPRLPEHGCEREDILREMEQLTAIEEARWKDGFVSGAVYHGDDEHIRFLNQVYAIHSQSNPLHADVWPSAAKFEAEIVSMTAHLLGADRANDDICGTVTSGGTESILLAMKTYRDWARATKKIARPEVIVPVTAHAAFDKAAQYFNIKLKRVPVGDDCRADVAATRKAITRNTIALVGSAPSFPHGVIDPIAELSELAREKGIGFHTDACLGGFVLPWAEKLGYAVPPFDFRLPGVTSMSADTHKYGYAAKGTSVVLYRGLELRHFQYYTATDWPGGLYFSPTFAGSRPGALSAMCWAAMVSLGERWLHGGHAAHTRNGGDDPKGNRVDSRSVRAWQSAVGDRLCFRDAGHLSRHGLHDAAQVELERAAPAGGGSHLRHAQAHAARCSGSLHRRSECGGTRRAGQPEDEGRNGARVRHGGHASLSRRGERSAQAVYRSAVQNVNSGQGRRVVRRHCERPTSPSACGAFGGAKQSPCAGLGDCFGRCAPYSETWAVASVRPPADTCTCAVPKGQARRKCELGGLQRGVG